LIFVDVRAAVFVVTPNAAQLSQRPPARLLTALASKTVSMHFGMNARYRREIFGFGRNLFSKHVSVTVFM
jgi:hypothetical protein